MVYRFFKSCFFALRNALLTYRVSLNTTVGERELIGVISKMRPVSSGRDLIRIGGEGDGGYLVPNDLEGISACFSPGVGNLSAFEEDLAKQYSIQSFLADYSVDEASIHNDAFDFEKKFLGTVNDDRQMRLEDWLERKAPLGDLILQMDIEGAEYGVFIDTPSEALRKFRIMVVEFHALDRMFDKNLLGMVDGIFDKILRDFCVVHIHPNNCSRVFTAGRVGIPRVCEFTFHRRDRAVFDHAKLSIPHRLDRKNVPHCPELLLPAIWHPE